MTSTADLKPCCHFVLHWARQVQSDQLSSRCHQGEESDEVKNLFIEFMFKSKILRDDNTLVTWASKTELSGRFTAPVNRKC